MLQEEQDSSTVLPFPGKIVYPSCLGPVVELDAGSYLQSSVLFITSFGLAYAATIYSSYFPKINCVKFLFKAIIELDTGSIFIERCPSIISFRLAYAPGRTGFSKLGLETGLRLVSLRHYLGLLHGDFCLR